jgi:hypothetical protein
MGTFSQITRIPSKPRVLSIGKTNGFVANFHVESMCGRISFGQKPKRMFSPAFMDLPSPAQGLDFSLALTHTQHAWRLKD